MDIAHSMILYSLCASVVFFFRHKILICRHKSTFNRLKLKLNNFILTKVTD